MTCRTSPVEIAISKGVVKLEDASGPVDSRNERHRKYPTTQKADPMETKPLWLHSHS